MKRRLLALCFVFIVALAAAGLLYRELRRPYRGYSGNLVIEIEPGTRTSEVAQSLVSRGVPNPAYCRMVQSFPRYMSRWIPRTNGNSPGCPTSLKGSIPATSSGPYNGLMGIPLRVCG